MTEGQLGALIMLFFLAAIVIGGIIELWLVWVKRRYIENFFPEWRNTKKRYIWFVIWSVCQICTLIPTSMAINYIDIDKYITICLWILSLLLLMSLGIIYVIVKHNIRYYYDRKKEKAMKKAEAEDQNRKEQSAETQPDKPAQNDSTDETDK